MENMFYKYKLVKVLYKKHMLMTTPDLVDNIITSETELLSNIRLYNKLKEEIGDDFNTRNSYKININKDWYLNSKTDMLLYNMIADTHRTLKVTVGKRLNSVDFRDLRILYIWETFQKRFDENSWFGKSRFIIKINTHIFTCIITRNRVDMIEIEDDNEVEFTEEEFTIFKYILDRYRIELNFTAPDKDCYKVLGENSFTNKFGLYPPHQTSRSITTKLTKLSKNIWYNFTGSKLYQRNKPEKDIYYELRPKIGKPLRVQSPLELFDANTDVSKFLQPVKDKIQNTSWLRIIDRLVESKVYNIELDTPTICDNFMSTNICKIAENT